MELILEKGLEHQQKAVEAIGQVFRNVGFSFDPQNRKNPVFSLGSQDLLCNIKELQKNVLPEHRGSNDIAKYLNLDIKMETGTGKTYVYTHTIYELNRLYGINKFIILVPSLPIKSGTQNFVSDLYSKKHFADVCGYGKEIELLTVESKSKKKGKTFFPAEVRDFVEGGIANSHKIYVLLMNMQLLTSGKTLTNEYDYGVNGYYQPLEAIASVRPFVVIDEPHRFSRDNKTFDVIKNQLKPQCIIRFGATFPDTTEGKGKNKRIIKDYHNLIYELDACDAFNKNLIKGVAKEHFVNPAVSDEKLKIVSTERGKSVNIKYTQKNSAKTYTVAKGDSLASITSALDGVSVTGITKNTVEFSNGIEKQVGEEIDANVYMSSYQEGMLKLALKRHFETEERNFCENRFKIKTLALFFIDDIYSYRDNGDKEPYLKNSFEKFLKESLQEAMRKTDSDEYREYLQYSLEHIEDCHAGYFSQDNNDSDEAIKQEVEDILRNKKKLLSFKDEHNCWNVRRFLFSKWTLKEGWDNPNVFTIAKLRSSGSENSKLQEVGRGLRLPVDENGNRVRSSEFYLNYIVDFTEADFAQKLVDEINGDRPEAMTITLEDFHRVLGIYKMSEHDLFVDLVVNDYIDFSHKINSEKKDELFAKYPEFNSGLKAGRIIDRDSKKNISSIKIRPDEYEDIRELWEKVNQSYLLMYQKEIDAALPKELPKLFEKNIFSTLYLQAQRQVIKTDNTGVMVVGESGMALRYSNPISFSEFLMRISKVTYIPLNILLKAMQDYIKKHGIIDKESINEQAVARFVSVFRQWKMEFLQGRFWYTKCDAVTEKGTALSNVDGSPRKEISAGRIGTKFDDGNAPAKYLYDVIAYDSALEQENIMSSAIDEIVVYGKIPRNSIAVPTIAGGTYSPDFMYVVKKQDGSKELNIIVETKDVETESELRGEEQVKIDCAKVFFEQMKKEGYTVNFVTQLKRKSMVNIVKDILDVSEGN